MSKAEEIYKKHLSTDDYRSTKQAVLAAMQEYAAFCCGCQRTVCFMAYKDSDDKQSIITAPLPEIVKEKL